MKKMLVIWLLSMILIFSLCGCGAEKDTAPDSKQPQESMQQDVLPVYSHESDPKAVKYLKMQYHPQENEDTDSIAERMWYLANYIYCVGEPSFSENVATEQAPGVIHTCRFIDFDELTAHLYTQNGKEQLLGAMVGGESYIQQKDGEYYHLDDWRTEPAYHEWMSGYQVVNSSEDKMELEVYYEEKDFDDNVIGKGSVVMTIVNQDGIWLIDDYQSPTARYSQQ